MPVPPAELVSAVTPERTRYHTPDDNSAFRGHDSLEMPSFRRDKKFFMRAPESRIELHHFHMAATVAKTGS